MRRAGLAVAGLPLVLVPAWATSSVAAGVTVMTGATAEQPLCDPATVPTSEALADATVRVNPAHQRMNVDEAHAMATGKGVKVAVVDSGIATVDDFARIPLYALPGTGPEMLSGHGTIVAGLIAGKDGVAPDAVLYDVKVFDGEGADETEGQKRLTSAGMVAGIRAVIDAMPRERFGVVNISLSTSQHDPALEAAIADLVARDVVVVAAAGNKALTTSSEDFEGTPGNDAPVYPADYDGVLAVSATPPDNQDPAGYVLPNLDTDVAAPTAGAISVNATGGRCVVDEVATSWAAAEVSGLVALLRERFPRETPRQIVARLQATTEGAGAAAGKERVENPWTGAGVVQANDALTRQLSIGPDGTLRSTVRSTRSDAQAPPAPEKVDLFGSSRALLLWFGLLGGALLALVFLLRPLLRR
ncbi:hypothetical protein EXE58_06765 [Nocardioides seonyuensis]|uniref:Peptidase S8/S53 domain-containing protein n=1 Tax=Nocardioides seonyuensis TaxID=2518371 RepID=A0A4P7IDE4_9ACTN|nr:S8 family serine peptidase [Nocardioides seonyuensis]QBX55184.1 hypothetical protein EXE58_06765 [Nocardioides seonyuensis]